MQYVKPIINPLLKLGCTICLIVSTSNLCVANVENSNSNDNKINCDETPFVEKNGILVVEVESVNPSSGWLNASSASGFTGESYFQWNSANKYNAPGSGLLQYKIHISTPGTYHFRWYNKIMVGSSNTDSNDSWLRIADADDFFAKNGTSIKYPKGGKFIQSNVTTEGTSSGGWMKVYCSGTTNWTWSCRTSDSDPHEIYATFNTAGNYTVQISGRSNGHAIDRFVLFQDSKYSVSQATNKALEETRCVNGTTATLHVKKAKVKVYPNPAKNFISIQNTTTNDIVELRIFDLAGKTILNKKTTIAEGATFNLKLQKLHTNSIYFLDITQRTGKHIIRKISLKN